MLDTFFENMNILLIVITCGESYMPTKPRKTSRAKSKPASIAEFSKQEDPLDTLKLAPLKQQAVWKQTGTEPVGVDPHRGGLPIRHDREKRQGAADSRFVL